MHAITVNRHRLECCAWGGRPSERPTVVLLHEGLGSVGTWRSFPEKLAAQTGWCVFAYSRAGYGNSDPVELPRPLDYLQREAIDVLPAVLDAIGFTRGVVLGHSDGASIATIHAGSVADSRIRGVGLMTPHFFTEPVGLAAIADAKVQYDEGDLRDRLARYHANVDNAFRGWNDAWLDPGFKSWNIEDFIGRIQSPILAIQGRNDRYGTLTQIETLANGVHVPLDIEILDNCRHYPHIEEPDRTLAAVGGFLSRLSGV